ncbi:MAG: ABC transporter permease [Stellaceae bacterium]
MSGVLRLIGRRLLQFVPIVIFATFVVFFLLQLVPGDPALSLAGDYASAKRIAEIRHEYGFDQPIIVQYGIWLWHVVHGNLGRSLFSSEPVLQLIHDRLPNTLLIAVYALIVSSVIGIPLGMLAATRQGSKIDIIVTSIASLGVAIPSFWLAIILALHFSLYHRWFPTMGAVSLFTDPWSAIAHATLPAISLAVAVIAVLARQVRSDLLEVLDQQYMRTLRAKGLAPGAILWKHGLRNVSATMVTLVGLQVNRLFSGAVVIEAVFAIPGIGSLVTYSALNKDFPVVQGIVLVVVLIVISVNLLVDIITALLDPRVAVG